MNVCQLLAAQVASRPHAPALLEGLGKTMTFQQLEQASSNVAGQLRARGVGVGSRVLVLLPMSTDLYVVIVALLRLGAVATCPDPGAGIADIDRACDATRPDALIGVPKAHALRLMSRCVRRVPLACTVRARVPLTVRLDPDVASARVEPVACGAEHPALVTFTSGSTGTPKVAVRSHALLRAQQQALVHGLSLRAGDIDLVSLPIVVLANLAVGAASILPDANLRRPGAIDPEPILRQIRRYRPTRVSASPAFLEQIVERAQANEEHLDSLERIYTGGAPIFPSALARIRAVAPQATVVAVYGSTEAEPIAHVSSSEVGPAERRDMIGGQGLLAGRIAMGTEVAILPDRWGDPLGTMSHDAFAALQLPPGRRGEIVVRGPHVLTHYLHGVGEAETKFRVGHEIWHRTGDAGWMDEAGRLWLLGRCAARIDDAAGQLYPFSVECAAMELSCVRRAAVVSWHEQRVLLLELRDSTSTPDVSALARALAWARVDAVRVVPEIPVDRRHNAKVDYARLQRLLRDSAVRRTRPSPA